MDFFENLARSLEANRVSRRQALWLLGTGAAGAAEACGEAPCGPLDAHGGATAEGGALDVLRSVVPGAPVPAGEALRVRQARGAGHGQPTAQGKGGRGVGLVVKP